MFLRPLLIQNNTVKNIYSSLNNKKQSIPNFKANFKDNNCGDSFKLQGKEKQSTNAVSPASADIRDKIGTLKFIYTAKPHQLNIEGSIVKGLGYAGSQEGSNPAYYFSSGDKLYYVKYPQYDVGQVAEEIVASKLYKAAGINTPEMHYVYDENNEIIGLASEYVPLLNEYPSSDEEIFDSYAVDAWLNNWDAPKYGNTFFTKDGAVKIDIGGALRYRAQGKRKELENNVSALYSLIDYNKYYYNGMTKEDLLKSIKHVTELPDEKITSIVKDSAVEEPEELIKTLIERKNYMKVFAENLKNINEDDKFFSLQNQIYKAKVETDNALK